MILLLLLGCRPLCERLHVLTPVGLLLFGFNYKQFSKLAKPGNLVTHIVFCILLWLLWFRAKSEEYKREMIFKDTPQFTIAWFTPLQKRFWGRRYFVLKKNIYIGIDNWGESRNCSVRWDILNTENYYFWYNQYCLLILMMCVIVVTMGTINHWLSIITGMILLIHW